jgi:hypothetical protein
MASKIKNIILFAAIGASLVLVYIFFIKKAPDQPNLTSVSSSDTSVPSDTSTIDQNSSIAQNFLSVLLSVKSIKLDDSIFSDSAFASLHDSSIVLTPPGPEDEGRPNPFAPLGTDIVTTPAPLPSSTDSQQTADSCVSPQILDTTTNTCITPPVTCQAPKILDTTTNTCVTPAKKS